MKKLDIRGPSTLAFKYLEQIEAVVGEPATLAKYLTYLGSCHPDPVAFAEIEKALNVASSQVSRTTRSLHLVNHRGQPGLDLVHVTFDVMSPRLKLVGLNSKGVRAVEKLVQPWMHAGD